MRAIYLAAEIYCLDKPSRVDSSFVLPFALPFALPFVLPFVLPVVLPFIGVTNDFASKR